MSKQPYGCNGFADVMNYNPNTHTAICYCFGGLKRLFDGDDNMKEQNWITNTNKVRLWLSESNRGDEGDAILLCLGLGDTATNDEMRSAYWTSISNIGKVFDDFPKARKGHASSLPTEVQVNVDFVVKAVEDVFAAIGGQDLLLTVLLPHGRTGGSFENIEAMAEYYGNHARRNLLSAYKDNRWDGSMNGNIPTMTPPPVKAEEGGQEEE